MAGATGFQQQHLVARIGGEAVGDGGTGGTRADNDVVIGLHNARIALTGTIVNAESGPSRQSGRGVGNRLVQWAHAGCRAIRMVPDAANNREEIGAGPDQRAAVLRCDATDGTAGRSEEHTSEL